MCANVACHSGDLPYIFNNVELANLQFNEKEKRLARRMGTYWTNFAKYGNPNGQVSLFNSFSLIQRCLFVCYYDQINALPSSLPGFCSPAPTFLSGCHLALWYIDALPFLHIRSAWFCVFSLKRSGFIQQLANQSL